MLNDIDSPESVEVGRLSEVFPDVNERLNGGFGCYKCTEKLTILEAWYCCKTEVAMST